MNSISKHQQGFALLLTMIVISVVLAIGLTLLNITLKQFTLSVTARESEVAFHAANTGMDCLRYYHVFYRETNDLGFLQSTPDPITCAGSTDTPRDVSVGAMYGHIYEFNINGVDGPACMGVSVYASDSDEAVSQGLSGEGLARFECPAGNTCTMIFSRGYNRACNDLDSIRTVQRELTITY